MLTRCRQRFASGVVLMLGEKYVEAMHGPAAPTRTAAEQQRLINRIGQALAEDAMMDQHKALQQDLHKKLADLI